MHDREQQSDGPDIPDEPDVPPQRFVLETTYKGEKRIVAQGVAFTDPSQVVINWRSGSSVELVDTVAELYEKFGNQPRVLWHTDNGMLTEAEPDELLDIED
jgi:hypothetical protein